ncbi:MAG: PHP domain-containing protein [Streptosporangiales bacterium]|nr:PHP domain-containing protein [Streptosporangiales bacterium]
MTVSTHRGSWGPDDRIASRYHYLPVDVPPGADGLRVRLSYDRSQGILDLGCLGPDGFRGWSGGARNTFVIAPDAATPGYLPGELEPGQWYVVLGLVRVPNAGLGYELTAETGSFSPPPPTPAPPVPERPPRRALPAGSDRRWLAGDLHSHTVHSDGAYTVDELAGLAAGRGLDFLAVTDHNTVSHHAALPAAGDRAGIVLLPGQELTTPQGHANAFGDIGWIDFREPPDRWLEEIERRGGLLSINHPIAGEMSWLHPMRRRPPLVEVWHWSWLDQRWTTPLAWWFAWDPTAVPVGGSDWHRPGPDNAPPGSPTTWVECPADAEPTESAPEVLEAVVDGLRAGRVALSARRDGPVLLRQGEELVAVRAAGTTLVGPDGPRARVRDDRARLPAEPGCHRLVDDTGATLALTP